MGQWGWGWRGWIGDWRMGVGQRGGWGWIGGLRGECKMGWVCGLVGVRWVGGGSGGVWFKEGGLCLES